MAIRNAPRSLQSSVHTARYFYKKCKALPLYDHCHNVFRRAVEVEMVEGDAINHSRGNLKRAWTTSITAEIMLYHVVDFRSIVGIREGRITLPFALQDAHPLRNEEVCKEIENFGKLTELDRKGAPLSEYFPLLNNEHAPLALLARLTDYAVTHDTEDRTPSHISNQPGLLFRMYSSPEHARKCLEAEAKAGERIHAPVAELFGYPTLAGDILKHAYGINHREIYDHVIELYEDEAVLQELHSTQALVRKLAKRIRRTLAETGFDTTVVPRMTKHQGKVMRKFYNRLVERHRRLEEGSNVPMEEFIHMYINEYNLRGLNDPVALRMVLDRFEGEDIDSMPERRKAEVIRVALAAVRLHLRILKMNEGYNCRHTFLKKDNGYRSHHFDARPQEENGLLPVEFQVRTREWDDIASHGKAAHYYYLGGDNYVCSDRTRFFEVIKAAYHDIIHRTVD